MHIHSVPYKLIRMLHVQALPINAHKLPIAVSADAVTLQAKEDVLGLMPLHIACEKGNLACVEVREKCGD